MAVVFKNWNDGEVKAGEVFHFRHSLTPFIFVEDSNDDIDGGVFVNLNSNELYHLEDLNIFGFDFYSMPEDPDYMGVKVAGHIELVSDEE